MATFRIPTNPPYFPNNNFNPAFNTAANASSANVQELQQYFLSYPQAQGKETLLDATITGDLILTSSSTFNTSTNLILDSSSNYIQFGDGTKQTTAPSADDPNTVYNDISNIFTSPSIQTFQGSNATLPTTAPLQFSNVTSGGYGSLYVDSNINNDLTIYSNQNNGSLTVRNPTNLFTINPSFGNVATFLNPISTAYNITGGQLTLSNGVNTSILTTDANGLNVNTPIVSTGSITGTSFKINTNTIGDDLYNIQSFGNFGVYIVNTSNNNAKLTLSNNGSIYGSVTCTAQNEFTFSGSTIVSSQTYPLTSSNQTATISYVNQAIASQGGGDVTSTGNNDFTGVNTFNGSIPTTTLTNTSNNQFATVAYVKSSVPQFNNISFINNNPNNSTMSPTTVDVSLVYNPAPNNVQWLTGGEFTITWINTGFIGALAILQFNEKPWADFPPPNFSSTILGYFTTSAQYYSCPVYWGSSGGVYTMGINIPSGVGTGSLPQNGQVIFNLTSMGSIPA